MRKFTLTVTMALSACAFGSSLTDHEFSSSNHASLKAYPSAVISVKDLKSGLVIFVENDGRHIVGLSSLNVQQWRTEVIPEGQKCLAGIPVIRNLKVINAKLSITYCKHSYGEIDIATGKYTFLGQD